MKKALKPMLAWSFHDFKPGCSSDGVRATVFEATVFERRCSSDGVRSNPSPLPTGEMMQVGSATQANWGVAVASKQLQNTREEGRQAVQLIQSATAGQPARAPAKAGSLNVVA